MIVESFITFLYTAAAAARTSQCGHQPRQHIRTRRRRILMHGLDEGTAISTTVTAPSLGFMAGGQGIKANS
jgi:hypothetical protein